ncbi:MAG: hypothetical protein GY747_10305 [Planctomycetes bacterium]|jgi:hypothetical protein|nr:hypothetical protein [Ralstonia insidiosa]KMW48122.1 hypothetical protein AC240_07220 [Ralstonia sp. MD27]MBX3770280.1 hypothetical protein [Ralstonia pickettii]MCP4093827.1 hypothetical protein [Planctomycetota bacterium]NPA02063.1 hypothetical protein [Betaproteobacteria bacterium]MBA9854442.1 hypothetical protein [Ralstonia insidiosa]
MALRPESMTFEMPQRPKPIEFAIQEPLDPMDLMVARENPAAFVSRMKNVMAAKLARMIVEKCQLFEVPDFARLSRDPCLRLQFTINDRGMYTNWLPQERQEGKEEGFKIGYKRAIDTVPYGLEPGQYYE